ncbi:MAG: hypothetical protein GYA14_14975 [Ignavibacteria bacterium]|nr:hypothetical protein [Ignavibacteria bacterium]
MPNHGFPYQIILGILRVNPGASPEEFATTIGTQYLNYYGETDNVTMSVVDLERISDLVTAINIFGDLLNQNFNNYVNEIEIARYSSQNYAIASYMDIYDFAERIMFQITQTDIVTAAQQVKEAVNHTIIFSGYKGFPVSSSHGIAIFFPLSSEDPSIWNDVDGNSYQDLDFVNDLHAAPQWNEFIIDYYYSLLFNTSKKEIL